MEEAEKEILNALSGHERREQIRKAKEDARQEKDVQQEAKEQRKQYFWIAFTLVILVAFAVAIWYFYTHRQETYTDREVHWHAYVDMSICGEHKDLPKSEGGDTVHGKQFKGIHLLHTHDDNIIHIEGLIQKKEDIALGRFFDVIEMPFDKDKIMDKKNGDLCPDGRPGILKMYVNDQPRTDFRDYVPFAAQDARKQIIKLVFEPEGGMQNKTNQSS